MVFVHSIKELKQLLSSKKWYRVHMFTGHYNNLPAKDLGSVRVVQRGTKHYIEIKQLDGRMHKVLVKENELLAQVVDADRMVIIHDGEDDIILSLRQQT